MKTKMKKFLIRNGNKINLMEHLFWTKETVKLMGEK